MLTCVRDLSSALLGPLGASRAQRATVEAFTEIEYKADDGGRCRPDGLIRVTYGRATWQALVEVKTGADVITAEQVNKYWDIARREGLDHVLTISNEIAPVAGAHPTAGLRVRSNSKVRVSHVSWTGLLTTAVRLRQHKGIDDPEQAWLLTELIRYLEHPASGALSFSDMGPNWVEVRDTARNIGATPPPDAAADIARRWDQLLRYGALVLGADLGRDVTVLLAKAQQDPRVRAEYVADELCRNGMLEGAIRVPDTAGDIYVRADLRARQIVVALDVRAPEDRGAIGRITWLVNQLKEAPAETVIEAYPRNARAPFMATLADAREQREVLAPERKEAYRFRVLVRAEMGMNRGSGGQRAGFVESVLGVVNEFYRSVVQHVSPWVPPTPKTSASNSSSVDVARPVDSEVAEVMRQAPKPVFVAGPWGIEPLGSSTAPR